MKECNIFCGEGVKTYLDPSYIFSVGGYGPPQLPMIYAPVTATHEWKTSDRSA